MCGEAAFDDLWDETVNLAKVLLNTSAGADDAAAWEELPVSHWKRRRVRPSLESFHMVPHPGDISSESGEEREGGPARLTLQPPEDKRKEAVTEASVAAECLVQL